MGCGSEYQRTHTPHTHTYKVNNKIRSWDEVVKTKKKTHTLGQVKQQTRSWYEVVKIKKTTHTHTLRKGNNKLDHGMWQ